MADTKLNQLIINELTKAQYQALTPESQQFYLVTDETPVCAGDNISTLTNDTGFITSAAITGKEDKTNKVTTLSSSSTDTQYPSAKLVYDTTEDIREIAAGKSTNYSISVNNNPQFDTQNSVINITSFITVDDVTHQASELKAGDNIYVVELGVPDRWCAVQQNNTARMYILETAKVPVTDVKKNNVSLVTNNVANIPNNLSDYADDVTHRLVTDTEKSTWTAKQDALPAITNDRFLHTNLSTGALEWSEVAPELYWCTYGTTTYDEIAAAVEAGKLPVVKYATYVYPYVGTASSRHYFTNIITDKSRYVRVTTANEWANGSQSLSSASTAVTHTKNTAAGSATQPVYVAADGTAIATTYELNKTVPADAVFTDTVTNVTTTGSGNAITSMTATNGQITATKGETFITSTDSSLSSAMPVNAHTLEGHAASYFLPASKCTLQTTAPTAAISDGGVHIVYLTSAPATKYDGYIYLIAEA